MNFKEILFKLFFLSFLFMLETSSGQDLHYSQIFSSPLNINPANAGFFKEKYRFCLNEKSQWSSISVPFQTLSFSADTKFKVKHQYSLTGLGILLNRDKAGDSDFGITQLNVSLSFLYALNNKGNQFLSFGIMPGIAQRTINLQKLTFGNQFDDATSSYNANLSSNETFSTNNFTFFDFSAGMHWSYFNSSGGYHNVGFSVYHINEPQQSFFNNSDIRLNKKFIFYYQSKISHSLNRLESFPCAMFEMQGNYKEFIIGSKLRYTYKDSPYEIYAFDFGIYTRVGDAAIFLLGGKYKDITIDFSYDINYSALHIASYYRGGLELSLQYAVNLQKYRRPLKMPCPIF